jgi:hypothetical protein
LPVPWDDDVARLLGQVARAIHRLVERCLAQRGDDEPPDLLASERAPHNEPRLEVLEHRALDQGTAGVPLVLVGGGTLFLLGRD